MYTKYYHNIGGAVVYKTTHLLIEFVHFYVYYPQQGHC